MMARTHIIFGAACWTAYAGMSGIGIEPHLVGIAAIASLLPDMDHPGSVFGRMIYPVSGIIGGVFGHRGITHSMIAVVAMGLLLVFYGGLSGHILAAICVGYLSHLLADWMTPSGVPLLYPSMKRFSSPFPVRTGGIGELFISILVLAGTYLAVTH